MPPKQPSSDHDLLIELRTQMVAVREDIKKLGDDTFTRISRLEQGAVSQVLVEDHEKRIRVMEKYQWLQMGAAGAIGGIVIQAISLISNSVHIIGN